MPAGALKVCCVVLRMIANRSFAMKEQQLKHAIDNLAEGLVPADVDLWPAIRARFETSQKRTHKGKNPMKTSLTLNRRTLVAFASALAVILFALFLAFTPQGRALAQEIIHFFTRAESDSLPLPTSTPLVWAAVTPGEPVPVPTFPPAAAFAADCGDYDRPRCTVAQIRGKVSFPVLELGTIPDGMQFIGSTGGPDGVILFYDNGIHTFGLLLLERPWPGNAKPQLPVVGANAVVETVRIGDVSGEYVQGMWLPSIPHGDPFTTPTPGPLYQTWYTYMGGQTLIWARDGVLFEIQTIDDDMDHSLDKAGLIALAAGLTDKPVSGAITPTRWTATPTPDITLFDGNAYDLTVAQAEALAGFDVLEPKTLPQILFLAGASYEPEQSIVRILYLEPSPLSHPFGLRLSEQVVSQGADCKLCGYVAGEYQDYLTAKNGMVIGVDAVLQTVQIGPFTGQYVEGMWQQWGSWKWVSHPAFKTLRWQANGMAFELYYAGFLVNNEVPISKADLIVIAESIME